jgi:hypothetical protein
MAVFKVKDREYEILEARGRNGRRAVNWLITRVGDLVQGGDEETDISALFSVLDDDVFFDSHLQAFVGKDAAAYIDEHATVGEMINGVLQIVEIVFEGFEAPEMDAALKNSEGAQEE